MDVSMAGVCMTSCSLLTKNFYMVKYFRFVCHKPTRLLHLTQIETLVLHLMYYQCANAFLQIKLCSTSSDDD